MYSSDTTSRLARHRQRTGNGSGRKAIRLFAKAVVWLTIAGALVVLTLHYRIAKLAAQSLSDPDDPATLAALESAGESVRVFGARPEIVSAVLLAARERRELVQATDAVRQERLRASLKDAQLWSHQPAIQRAYFETALSAAKATGHDTDDIYERIAQLPHSTKLSGSISLKVIASKRVSPGFYIDFEVIDREDEAVLGLTAADFTLKDGEGSSFHQFAVAPIRSESVEQNVCIVLDSSESMKGVPMAEQLLAVQHFLAQCGRSIRIELVAFDASVRVLTPFTNDHSLLLSAMQGLEATGSTSLASAVETGAMELAARSGNRVLVLCTDGRETAPSPDIDRVVSVCKARNVTIYALGADTPQLNRSVLTRLTSETGGRLFLATSPAALTREFDSLLLRLSRPSYRIIGLDPQDGLRQVTVSLVGAPATSLAIPLKPATDR